MSLDFHGPGLWYATRATGLVAMLLLTVGVLFGIITAGRFAGENWPRFLSQGLHRNISLLVLAFLALHVGTTVVDTYTSIPLAAAFVPFASAYKTAWLGLGAVALDLLLALVATSLARRRLGHRAARAYLLADGERRGRDLRRREHRGHCRDPARRACDPVAGRPAAARPPGRSRRDGRHHRRLAWRPR